MSCLLDTSFLVRLVNVRDALHRDAALALAALFDRGEVMYISAQIVVEFWSVATRPSGAPNGLGLTVQETSEIVDVFLREFQLATDTPDVFRALRSILSSVEVLGKQVHDARLVAICHTHGIRMLVTFNPRHFVRFSPVGPGVSIAEPAAILKGKA